MVRWGDTPAGGTLEVAGIQPGMSPWAIRTGRKWQGGVVGEHSCGLDFGGGRYSARNVPLGDSGWEEVAGRCGGGTLLRAGIWRWPVFSPECPPERFGLGGSGRAVRWGDTPAGGTLERAGIQPGMSPWAIRTGEEVAGRCGGGTLLRAGLWRWPVFSPECPPGRFGLGRKWQGGAVGGHSCGRDFGGGRYSARNVPLGDSGWEEVAGRCGGGTLLRAGLWRGPVFSPECPLGRFGLGGSGRAVQWGDRMWFSRRGVATSPACVFD